MAAVPRTLLGGRGRPDWRRALEEITRSVAVPASRWPSHPFSPCPPPASPMSLPCDAGSTPALLRARPDSSSSLDSPDVLLERSSHGCTAATPSDSKRPSLRDRSAPSPRRCSVRARTLARRSRHLEVVAEGERRLAFEGCGSPVRTNTDVEPSPRLPARARRRAVAVRSWLPVTPSAIACESPSDPLTLAPARRGRSSDGHRS